MKPQGRESWVYFVVAIVFLFQFLLIIKTKEGSWFFLVYQKSSFHKSPFSSVSSEVHIIYIIYRASKYRPYDLQVPG